MSETSHNPDPFSDVSSNLISVLQASKISGLTPSYIRRLLRENVIQGKKIGRDWFMTEDAIREYMAQDRRPGPKPGA